MKYKKFLHLYIFFVVSIFLVLSMNISVNAEELDGFRIEEQKRVLFISSDAPDSEVFSQQMDGLEEVLDFKLIDLDMEFMDNKRLDTYRNVSNFYQTLEHKIHSLPEYDAVIVSGEPGLNFVLNNKDALFPDVPIVFFEIESKEISEAFIGEEQLYFLNRENFIKETIELAMKTNPYATKIYGIFDETSGSRLDKEVFFSLKKDYEDYSFEIFDLKDMSFLDLRIGLENQLNADIVYYSSAIVDNYHTNFSYKQSMDILTNYYLGPIYSDNFNTLGLGIVGGKMISYKDEGRMAGEKVVEIIFGVSGDQIDNDYAKIYIDDEVRDKLNIATARIPDTSIRINKKNDFWEQYRIYITVGILVMLFQMIIIIIMFVNIHKRRSAEKKLYDANEVLEDTNKDLLNSLTDIGRKNAALATALNRLEEKENEIHSLVYEDTLTSLANRYAITKYIDDQLRSPSTRQLDIIFLDVDNFKSINDTFGHDVGDQVIIQTGERLKKYQNDLIKIGRFGGDEFLIVLKNIIHSEEIESYVSEIQKSFENVIFIRKKKFYLTVSMGISTYPDHGLAQNELIKKADRALYKAKNKGKNTYVKYNSVMDDEIDDKLEFQAAIKEAYMNEEFYLNYQPYYDVQNVEVTGFEALIRWYTEDLGNVSPYKLITNAEEMGLIVEIGEWIFKEAVLFSKKINENSNKPIYVSINLSAVQLMNQDIYESLTTIVEELEVDPRYICLEMTETIMMSSIEVGINVIDKFKAYGFSIALDDFGTGYSSLSYFKRLSADILKLDKSFIDNIEEQGYDYHIIEAMIKLAHGKGLKVTAEGVELAEQFEVLKALQCDVIQGYYFGKPMGEEEALKRVGINDMRRS